MKKIQLETIGNILETKGPLTGSELLEASGIEGLTLWGLCMSSADLFLRSVARHYLRLDRKVPGFARLSPSIYREFLTYTIIGTRDQQDLINEKASAITERIREISRAKLSLAKSVVSGLGAKLDTEFPLEEHLCVFIAGDIVFDMAHDVPRPERSTGKLVRGSDMDIVVIVDDVFPRELAKRIDEAIFAEKHRLLMTPHIREEIDYVVKDTRKVRVQLEFDTFKHMVACKIMHEGRLLYGSQSMFNQIRNWLREKGVTRKLEDLEHRAWTFRQEACRCLRASWEQESRHEILCLFYPSEESEEFE
ncbi:MAG: hypothetical protein DRH12_07315 [Deltaproteobacteria bacterium]|nr:MAG: hypothetical protein DRH12_07315 [Deltaproteobacteria bacterium]